MRRFSRPTVKHRMDCGTESFHGIIKKVWLPVEPIIMGVASCNCGVCTHVDLPTLLRSMAVLMNTNLTLDSDVDDPVVDNKVDDVLFVGLFVLDVENSLCKLTVRIATLKLRPCFSRIDAACFRCDRNQIHAHPVCHASLRPYTRFTLFVSTCI